MSAANSSPPGNCKFAIPKKGRLHEKVVGMLRGAGLEFRREERLDVALCVGQPITLVFLPASDIAKYVGEGNVDIGITGLDVVKESMVEVTHVMDLGFGACKLCVQAPVADNVTDVASLAGKRIVTSFPDLTREFFAPFDAKKGVETKIKFVSGSVEAACGLGLADAVVDLVETGTTMKVSRRINSLAGTSILLLKEFALMYQLLLAGCRAGSCGRDIVHPSHFDHQPSRGT
jgi:ATP phosphoribosyltransferase